MNHYVYNKEYQALQQYDEQNNLRSSMSMPQSDLNKLARLNIKENILNNTLIQTLILIYFLE